MSSSPCPQLPQDVAGLLGSSAHSQLLGLGLLKLLSKKVFWLPPQPPNKR